MMDKKFSHVVSVRHLLTTHSIIGLATWCSHNFELNTWCWGGGEFKFQKHDDAVQFALLLD